MNTSKSKNWLRGPSCAVGLLMIFGAIGCQSTYNGQNLPSPYYEFDDIQYYAPGPEFRLSREAAAAKANQANLELQGR